MRNVNVHSKFNVTSNVHTHTHTHTHARRDAGHEVTATARAGRYSEIPSAITEITRPYCNYDNYEIVLFLHASGANITVSVHGACISLSPGARVGFGFQCKCRWPKPNEPI